MSRSFAVHYVMECEILDFERAEKLLLISCIEVCKNFLTSRNVDKLVICLYYIIKRLVEKSHTIHGERKRKSTNTEGKGKWVW
jgi:hypothetical protein